MRVKKLNKFENIAINNKLGNPLSCGNPDKKIINYNGYKLNFMEGKIRSEQKPTNLEPILMNFDDSVNDKLLITKHIVKSIDRGSEEGLEYCGVPTIIGQKPGNPCILKLDKRSDIDINLSSDQCSTSAGLRTQTTTSVRQSDRRDPEYRSDYNISQTQ